MGLFDRLKKAFQKTREALGEKISAVFSAGRKLDAELLAELEDVLLASDVGVDTTDQLLAELREAASADGGKTPPESLLRQAIADVLRRAEGIAPVLHDPHVVMVVGVNGTGKTTTVGKLAQVYKQDGKSVVVAAADTFRAAAIEQMRIWAERSGVQIIAGSPGGDSAAVAFDALDAVVSRKSDVLLIDTAGRLHTKANLMKELEKVSRVLKRKIESAPHEVLLVLDATTGQNGVNQAIEFTKAAPVTGLVLTKIDGTAKGGVILAIAKQLGIPIRYVGFGEGIEDLAPFDADKFAESLLGDVRTSPVEES
ncbi:signal recognition particle-docking protein FtsY [bacterium]|nr:signal recognition particle-docking protein FtsY [bacterium]MBU1983791.1 signal recognition particle-docking protein FtsY [bacterium]